MQRKTTIQKSLIIIASLLFSISALEAQTTIYNENFDADSTSLPTGWTATTGGWAVKKTNVSTGYTGASGLVNAVIDNSVSTTGIYDLISKPVSTTGYNNITAIWGARVTNHFADSGSVVQGFYWSNNSGSTWNQLTYTENATNSTWALDNATTPIALPIGAANQASVLFKWTVNLHHSSSGTYRIDDFKVQGTSVAGINEYSFSNAKVYSFNKTLFIQLNNTVAPTGEVKMYSLCGTELYSQALNEQNHKIDLSSFAEGMYVVRIQAGNSIITKKIIID